VIPEEAAEAVVASRRALTAATQRADSAVSALRERQTPADRTRAELAGRTAGARDSPARRGAVEGGAPSCTRGGPCGGRSQTGDPGLVTQHKCELFHQPHTEQQKQLK
jgi:hypothetical protein